MKTYAILTAVLLTSCSRLPEPVQWRPPIEPARVSMIEFVSTMSSAEIAKEEEPYRTWLVAQRTGFCELHHSKMYRQWIPIAYGLPAAGSLPDNDEAQAFPHGEEVSLGGCLVSATKEHEVYLCPECVKACREWKAKKPKPNQSPEPTAGLRPTAAHL